LGANDEFPAAKVILFAKFIDVRRTIPEVRG
jgi:hypothetical protein